jgi:hypothetical protein
MLDASSAIVELPPCYGEEIYRLPLVEYHPNSGSTSAGSRIGKWADIITTTIDNSGAMYRVSVMMAPTQPGLLALLERWISEYSDQVDPDLDKQLQSLEQNPLQFE